MSETNIIQINSSLSVLAAQSADYSTLLAVDCNHLTFDRATVYATASSYSSTVPVGSNLRKILDSAFSASVRPPQVIAGRAKGTAILSFTSPTLGTSYDFTITVSGGTFASAAYSATSGDTAESVAIALKADIDAVDDITDEVTATVVGTGADAVLEISLDDTDYDFTLTNVSDSVTASGRITEPEADIIAGIQEVNSDWTFVVSTDHSASHVLAMAAVCNTLQKPYFTSSNNEECYQAWDEVSQPDANNIGAQFAFRQYNHAHAMYHDQADSYPEAVRVTEHTFLTPGKDSYQYKPLSGFGVAQIADGSRPLSTNELYNLSRSHTSTIISFGGRAVVGGYEGRGNRMGSGIGIRTIVIKKYFEQELLQLTQTLFLRFRNLAMNKSDLTLFKSKWASFLDKNVSSGAGNSSALAPSLPYEITMPDPALIDFEDKVEGVLQGTKISCYLDPSIDRVVLNLDFTFTDAEGA